MRSVVLAACQGERYIGEQLDSIVSQISQDDEIIISDDASTDATLTVVEQRCDQRIRLLANGVRIGYIGNFQRALERCRGDTIFFSDQDDIWLPNKVKILEHALQNKKCAASDAIVVDEHLSQIYPSFFQWRRTRDFSAWSLLMKPTIVGATIACSHDYLRTLLPLPAGVPHDFWISFNAAWDNALEIVDTPLILYRRHDAALSLSATQKRRSPHSIAAERIRLLSAVLVRRCRGRGTVAE